MDKVITLIIGGFLYGIFGNIVNYLLYYLLFIFRIIFDLFYFISNLFGVGLVGITLLSIGFYALLLFSFKTMLDLFIKS